MDGDIVARKVVQDVLLFVWDKQGVITETLRPQGYVVPEISAEFMNNLCVTIYIDSYCVGFQWENFFKNHFKRMILSPYLYANYVAYATYLTIREIDDAYEMFLGALSLITHFALYCWQNERKEFLNTCVDLFCAFYEREIRAEFEKQGSWTEFDAYLYRDEGSLKKYKDLLSINKGVIELFKELQEEHMERTEPYVLAGVVLEEITETDVEDDNKAVTFADSVVSKMSIICSQTFEKMLADFEHARRRVEELYRDEIDDAFGVKAIEEEPSPSQEDQESGDVAASKMKQSPSLKKGEGSTGKVKQSPSAGKTGKTKQSPSQKSKGASQSPSQKSKGASQSPSQKSKGASQSPSQKNEASQGKAKTTPPSKTGAKKKKGQINLSESLDSSESLNFDDFSPTPQSDQTPPKLSKKERGKKLVREMGEDLHKLLELIKFIAHNEPMKEEDAV